MRVRPQNWADPASSIIPSDEELLTLKQQIKIRIKALVIAAGKPMDSLEISKQLEKEGLLSGYVNIEKLCRAVDRQWHPDDYVGQGDDE